MMLLGSCSGSVIQGHFNTELDVIIMALWVFQEERMFQKGISKYYRKAQPFCPCTSATLVKSDDEKHLDLSLPG